MSGGGEPVPVVPWNLDVDPGDPVDLFGHSYVFERVDPDGAVTFRPPVGSGEGDFMVVGDDGRGRKPTMSEVGQLMASNDCIWREKPLRTEARRYARSQELDAEQARELDEVCQFRAAIMRRFDANPWSKSDYSLKCFMAEAMKDPKIAAMPGAWHASPATLRTWLRERGEEGCRKELDGVSMKNRMPQVRKIDHPLEIVFYHAARATNLRGDVRMNHDSYVAEIDKINTGIPLHRNFWIDPDGEAGPCERPAVYDVPKIHYTAMSYHCFWRLCRELRSAKSHGSKTTPQGAYQRYGGGGVGDVPSHLGALCWMDATPIPKVFFVDDETGIPIGMSTMMLLLEHRSKVVAGWDLAPGGPTASAVLRTVLCANQPKEVPEDILKIDPNLTWLRLKPDTIRFDNATEHHGRTVEDNFADAYIGTDFVGSRMPRDKNVKERVIRTFLDLVFKHMPDANYDIARMRLYGFDPAKGHVLCSIRTGQRLLARAVMTYNVSRNRALKNRQPALVWRQSLGQRKLNVIKDVDKFERSIGTVDFIKMRGTGIDFLNRHYTAGAVAMKRIVQQFERTLKVRKGDSSPRPTANTDDRKAPKWDVKIKYDEDDLGVIRVWNPHATPPQWEDFECTDPEAFGLPRWLDEKCRELAAREAMDYLSPEGQSVVRARLFEEIANVDSQAAERDRRTLAKAVHDPNVRQVMAGYVHVRDEVIEKFGQPQPERDTPAGHESAVGARKDAHIKTPRAKLKPAAEPVRMRRAASAPATPARATTDPAAPPPRRAPRKSSRNADPRDAGTPAQSAERPDQRTPTRARSKRLNYGDMF